MSTNDPRYQNGPIPIIMRISLLIVLIITSKYSLADDAPIIAVASNLAGPMAELSKEFTAQTGEPVRLTYGSSGNLSRQIVQGAPFELFISAGEEYVDFLIKQEVSFIHQTEYIYGEIGIFIPKNSQLYNLDSFNEVISALNFNTYRKIVIANPEHAPYGVTSIQALKNAGLWAIETNRLILAESVSQVVPYALSGNVDMAIIPNSFILQNNLQSQGKYYLFPETLYTQIVQHIVSAQ